MDPANTSWQLVLGLTGDLLAWCRPGAAQGAGGQGVITWASRQGGLCLGELAGSVRQGVSYVGSYGSNLQPSQTLSLTSQESILQVTEEYRTFCHSLLMDKEGDL